MIYFVMYLKYNTMDNSIGELLKTINVYHLSKLTGINYARLADTIKYQNGMKLREDEVEELKHVFKTLNKQVNTILQTGRSL